MKDKPEMHEGKDAFTRFDSMVGKVLSVPHSELARREKQYQNQVAKNPNKRGPKRKAK